MLCASQNICILERNFQVKKNLSLPKTKANCRGKGSSKKCKEKEEHAKRQLSGEFKKGAQKGGKKQRCVSPFLSLLGNGWKFVHASRFDHMCVCVRVHACVCTCICVHVGAITFFFFMTLMTAVDVAQNTNNCDEAQDWFG